MKKIALLACLFFLAGFASAQTVAINKKGFFIDKKNVLPGWLLSTCQSALGTGSRDREGYNYTHTYDNKGVVLFESLSNKVRSGNVNEVQFHYNVPEPNEVTPKGTFTGSITVEKLKASKYTTYEDVKKALKKWTLGDSYMEHNYRYNNDKVYIYFQFNDAETELQKISVGPQKN